MRHRRRRGGVLLLLVVATGLVCIDLARDRTPPPVFALPTPAATTAAPVATPAVLVPVIERPTPSPAATTFPVTGPGTFAYACRLHPEMQATIVVDPSLPAVSPLPGSSAAASPSAGP